MQAACQPPQAWPQAAQVMRLQKPPQNGTHFNYRAQQQGKGTSRLLPLLGGAAQLTFSVAHHSHKRTSSNQDTSPMQ